MLFFRGLLFVIMSCLNMENKFICRFNCPIGQTLDGSDAYTLLVVLDMPLVYVMPANQPHRWSTEKGHEITLVTAYPVDVNKLDDRIRLRGIKMKERKIFNVFQYACYLSVFNINRHICFTSV